MRGVHHGDAHDLTGPEQCSRLEPLDRLGGTPQPCPRPVAWSGRFRDRSGHRETVFSCDAHAGVLRGLTPEPEVWS